MLALKWNLKQKQRFTSLQNSCVNFVLGIRLARWSSGSRFLETLRAAAPVLIVIYPLPPLLCLHYPLLFGHHRACLGTKTKDGPRYLALSVAWIEGWGTMFGCFNAALIPLPPPLLISACNNTILFRNLPHPHPTQFSTSPISHSILYCKNTKLDPSLGNAIATSTDSSNSFREFLFAPLPFPPPSVDEAGMSPLPGIAN